MLNSVLHGLEEKLRGASSQSEVLFGCGDQLQMEASILHAQDLFSDAAVDVYNRFLYVKSEFFELHNTLDVFLYGELAEDLVDEAYFEGERFSRVLKHLYRDVAKAERLRYRVRTGRNPPVHWFSQELKGKYGVLQIEFFNIFSELLGICAAVASGYGASVAERNKRNEQLWLEFATDTPFGGSPEKMDEARDFHVPIWDDEWLNKHGGYFKYRQANIDALKKKGVKVVKNKLPEEYEEDLKRFYREKKDAAKPE